jgi:hypothetical protein
MSTPNEGEDAFHALWVPETGTFYNKDAQINRSHSNSENASVTLKYR